MILVIVIAVVLSIIITSSFDKAIRDALDKKLPETISTLRIARFTDVLAVSSLSMQSIATEEERAYTFQRVDEAAADLKAAVATRNKEWGEADQNMVNLFSELNDNIARLKGIVQERLILFQHQEESRNALLANLLKFQQALAYRVRILEGDGDVISRLMARPNPPLALVANMADNVAPLLSIPRFYANIESINTMVLAASQDKGLSEFYTARETIRSALEDAENLLLTLPVEVREQLLLPFEALRDQIRREEGLLRLSEKIILLREESQDLYQQNTDILTRINLLSEEIVQLSLEEIEGIKEDMAMMRSRSILFLLGTMIISLIGIMLVMHFQIGKNTIRRLDRLSRAMQHVAQGYLDVDLPPAGEDELGRLAAALHQFRTTAVEAQEREKALEEGNLALQKAKQELEVKSSELEEINKKLKDISNKDSLTGLYNRRRFDEILATEWDRSGHGQQPLALVFIDVDHFKKYNDHYGHQAGDQCLKNVAEVLKTNARRAGDLAARYGGEEFCLICPYTSMEDAENLAQEIRKAVYDLAIEHTQSPYERVTVSVGYYSSMQGILSSSSELLHIVDEALYLAKSKGRNTIQSGHT